LLDSKGRFEFQETEEKEKGTKLCRIIGKRAIGKESLQLETNDGRTIVEKKSSLKPGDSILLSVPEQKISKEIRLDKGAMVYIVAGEHSGGIAKVKEVVEGTMNRPKLVSLEQKESSFLTVADNVFVVGENKPEISFKVEKDE